MADQLVYCRRCGHWHARAPRGPVGRRQMVLGMVLYALLRTLQRAR
jgi:hypothetical protein